MESLRRREEENYQTEKDTFHDLFQDGTWLQRPVKEVMEVVSCFDMQSEIRVLDLGCGVGRNSIPIAKRFQNIDCKIEAVDLFEVAIAKLKQNSKKFHVDKFIDAFAMPVEDYNIQQDTYDYIIAISSLEHVKSNEAFIQTLIDIKNGTKKNGMITLIINTEMQEKIVKLKRKWESQFEITMTIEDIKYIVNDIFNDCEIIKENIEKQTYTIRRSERKIKMHTDIVTYIIKK